jgi:hypothetical protein
MVIRQVLWYASESWTLDKKSESALDASERKVLRRILIPMKENSTWKLSNNNELCRHFEELRASNIITLKRLQRAGHIQLMGEKLTKKDSGKQHYWKRPVGKSRKRWVNAVEIDSREILKVRNWNREPLDRQVWRDHIKEAKA